jgi:hypothetical protein
MQYAAKSAWQCPPERPRLQPEPQLQVATTARRRGLSRKRWARFLLETIHTLRAPCLQRAGVLIYPHGVATLDVGITPGVADGFRRLDRLWRPSVGR